MLMLNSNDLVDSAVPENSAKTLVLLYKLDKIRNHIENRLEVVDPLTRSELEFILNMIHKFEEVPENFKTSKPLVPESNITKMEDTIDEA